MKTINIMLIISILVLLFTGCGTGNNDSFIRPHNEFGKYNVRRFKNEKLVSINIPAKETFTWAPGIKMSGSLTFEVVYTTQKNDKWLEREINLSIKIGEDTILSMDLENDKFLEKGPNILFRKSISVDVTLDRSDKLFFAVSDSSGLGGDNFDLANLLLIPVNRPDHRKNRNILLITIDTLRADYLGYYRKLKELFPEKISFSPNLDKLAEENLIFTKAYTPISSTWPAISSLVRSRMPFEHGVQRNGDQLENSDLSLGHHLFKDWYSVSFRANAFQLDLGGFDEVHGFVRKDRKLKNRALSFLKENYKKKFFLWLHFLGVHAEYRPDEKILSRIEPEKYTGNITKAVGPVLKKITSGEKKVTGYDIEHIRNCYAGELLQLDEWLKEIFDIMKKNKIWDNTLIIISADHGEDLYQHNNHFFHHPSIYNTSLHVPLIIKFPYSKYKGVIDQNVSIMDFMPTLLDYYGIKTEYRMTGESLMPLIRGDVKKDNRYLFAESENNRILSIIGERWKFIYNPDNLTAKTQYGNLYPIGKEEFYDLKSDRLESDNLLKGEDPGIYKKLKFDLIKYIKLFQLNKQKKDRKDVSDLPEDVKKELKSLGYI